MSTGRSIAIGCDESNAVYNYDKEQRAIAEGYTMKSWITCRDNRVRSSHIGVDGKTINIFKPFTVGESLMMFPMDNSLGADKREIFGCRCIVEYSSKTSSKYKSSEDNQTIQDYQYANAYISYVFNKEVEFISSEEYNQKYKQVSKIETAEEANDSLKEKCSKPPYKAGTKCVTFELQEDREFVRVYKQDKFRKGSWLMIESAIKGLTPKEIAEIYALPEVPNRMVRVKLHKGEKIRVGVVERNYGHEGGAIQIDTWENKKYVGDFYGDIRL